MQKVSLVEESIRSCVCPISKQIVSEVAFGVWSYVVDACLKFVHRFLCHNFGMAVQISDCVGVELSTASINC